MFGGTFVFWHWEAMLISYLATRVVVLPFNSLVQLVGDTDINIALSPSTSYEDSFRYSKEPLWMEAW